MRAGDHERMIWYGLSWSKLCSLFRVPNIDPFASPLNKQLEHWASWLPDSGSCIIDAVLVSWHSLYAYTFPPFSMIWPALKKVQRECQKAWVIVPKWTTQMWFPLLHQLAVAQPREICSTLLTLPRKKNIHSLSPKLRLLAVLCSNDIKEKKIIQNKLPKCYQQHGGKIPKISMKGQSKGTSIFSKKGRLIHAIQIITWLLSFSHKNLKGICLLLPLMVWSQP